MPLPAFAQGPIRDLFRVAHRKTLPADTIDCERIALGDDDDYKPDLVMLPSGELLLVAFHQHKKDGGKVLEQNLLFRSRDGGRTWSKPQKLDLLGREPYLTVLKDGTLFITGHLLANDTRNKHGYIHGYLHRSTDAGKSWESIRIESEGIKPRASNHSTRNVLQMADGTLVLGVDYDGGAGPYLMWRSTDGGKSWDKTGKCSPKDFKSQYGFFGGETWLWQARSGKVWALVRVDSNELPIKDRPIKAGNDQSDHFILFSSVDKGHTFERIHDFGDYGEMYMSILRLADRRLLLTFTTRDLKPPLGVRALVGVETDDGFDFDFSHDRLMLDTRTPIGKSQGGGFGPTVQVKDGTLVTAYSYRGQDDKTHLEVMRWNLPAAQPEPPKHVTNSVGMKFVWIPPGAFMMGSPSSEKGRGDDEIVRKVTLSRGFYMGMQTVTQEEWQSVMGGNPSHFKGDKNLPVEQVSWNDCQVFCKKLAAKEAKPYRLPTEAEWEYACRAGTATAFSTGATISTAKANYNGNFVFGPGKKGGYREKTTPIGSFPANAWSLFDMHGNVWQWCHDWHGGYSAKELVDPQGPKTGTARVLRGGAWGSHPIFCRSANRNFATPDSRTEFYGCRVCFDPPATPLD